jgi:hypothetical protein
MVHMENAFHLYGMCVYSSIDTNSLAERALLGCIDLVPEIWMTVDQTIRDNIEWNKCISTGYMVMTLHVYFVETASLGNYSH